MAASRVWGGLSEVLEADFEYRLCGGLAIGETDHDLSLLSAKHELERRAGLATNLIDGAEARRIERALGPTVAGAVVSAEDGFVNPLALIPAYLAAAARYGAALVAPAPLTELRHRAGSWEAVAGAERIRAPVVIDAAGPWLHDVSAMAGRPLRLVASSIQMQATVRCAPLLDHLVQHISQGLSVKQSTTGTVLIGGGWPAAAHRSTGRSPVSMASMQGNLAVAVRTIPALGRLRVLRAWAGPYCVTADELPIAGWLDREAGFLVAGGPHAFTLGPLWGRVCRDLVLGRTPEVDLGGLEPGRLSVVAESV